MINYPNVKLEKSYRQFIVLKQEERDMSERQGFAGGFLAGAIVGGIVGGLIGSAITSRRNKNLESDNQSLIESGERIRFETEEEVEKARRTLESKIAQLNHAIDDVRQQLGTVNTNGVEDR